MLLLTNDGTVQNRMRRSYPMPSEFSARSVREVAKLQGHVVVKDMVVTMGSVLLI